MQKNFFWPIMELKVEYTQREHNYFAGFQVFFRRKKFKIFFWTS